MNNKLQRKSYDDQEVALLNAAAEMVLRYNLATSYAAESLAKFYPNRSIKAIELRLSKSLKELKNGSHVTLVISEKESVTSNTTKIEQSITTKTEKPLDPFNIVLDMLNNSNTEKETTVVFEQEKQPIIPEVNDSLEKKDKVILPHFNHSHIGDVTIVRVMHITEYGFFAENGAHTGLVHVSDISSDRYLSHDDLLNMFEIGDALEVVVDLNPFNRNKVLLKPTTYDSNKNIVLLNRTDAVNDNTVTVEEAKNYSQIIDLSKLDEDMLTIFPVHLESNLLTSTLKHETFNSELNETEKTMTVSFDSVLSAEQIAEFQTAIDESINFLV